MTTNTPITIYNKYFDLITQSDRWQRHVIYETFWESHRSVNFNKGMSNNSKCKIYIPSDANYFTDYIDPIAFRSNHINHWTIQNGDLVVRGIITDEIVRQSDLERKYDDVCVVSYVAKNDYGSSNMHHFEVLGI